MLTAICAIADSGFDAGNGNKLMRLVGSFNDQPDSLLKQYFPTSSSIRHPLHHHVFTFLTGDERDITACIPTVVAGLRRDNVWMLRALP